MTSIDLLRRTDMRDVCEWNWDGQFRMRLHNFYLFLDTIELIEQSI